ncbi:hypothetical protein [Rhodococcus sp. YH3-3]|uniref:hypothetical protein n=1 Tax=Rhodococcus sp. YH3-3 TaxID=1803579 RepID=UPI0007DAFF87|nr:hypothetical protein [Rhodococcus sp. YH3-3]
MSKLAREIKSKFDLKGGDMSEVNDSSVTSFSPDKRYRDPYMETQEAIYEYMGEDPNRSFPIQELASLALRFGAVDPLDLTLSATIGLQQMGLVNLDRSHRNASISDVT